MARKQDEDLDDTEPTNTNRAARNGNEKGLFSLSCASVRNEKSEIDNADEMSFAK